VAPGAISRSDQFPGPRIRQGLEQDAIEDAEHGGVRADAERERQDDDHREREVVADDAAGVTNVLPERVNDRDAELIAIGLPGLRQPAHRAPRGSPSLLRRQPARTRFGLERVQVMGQLYVQVRVEPATTKPVDEARPAHASPAFFARNLAIRVTVVSQFLVSS